MPIVAFLSRLVVIRANHQRTVSPGAVSKACQANRLAGAVGAGTGQNLDSFGGAVDDSGDDPLMFIMIESGRLTGSADRRQAIGPLLDVPIHEAIEFAKIDLAVAEGRDEGYG